METPGANLHDDVPEGSVDPLNDHEAKGHLNTLMDAHHILNDPDKMARVHALAGRHGAALSGIKSVSDLKDVYKQKYGLGHLASSAHQENDEGLKNNAGDGNTGNTKSAGSKAKPHVKSSPKQKNDEVVSGYSSGSGSDGN